MTIVASRAAAATFADSQSGYGQVVYISHETGVETRYAMSYQPPPRPPGPAGRQDRRWRLHRRWGRFQLSNAFGSDAPG